MKTGELSGSSNCSIDNTFRSLGISNGVGAIWGAVFFGYFLNERFEFAQRSRTPVFLIGSVGQLIALVLIYLNHPNRSPIEETEGFGAFGFEPQVWICLLCGFLLCLGDALFNVQVISLIGTMYTETSDKSSAYALFKVGEPILGRQLAIFLSYISICIALIFVYRYHSNSSRTQSERVSRFSTPLMI